MANENGKGGGHGRLTWFIVGAIALAIAVAVAGPWALGQDAEGQFRYEPINDVIHVGGEIFLRLLQMIVVPLVMASVMSGILGLGDVRKLGRPGTYAVLYYLSTTVLAVLTGLLVVNIIYPGRGVTESMVKSKQQEGRRRSRVPAAQRSSSFSGTPSPATAPTKACRAARWRCPESGAYRVRIVVVQRGTADSPAEVAVEWSRDGKEFEQLEGGEHYPDGVFEAKTAPGVYRTDPAIELPPAARHVQLRFLAQQGDGGESIVEAYLTPGPPGIGDIFENLVLMLFTDNLLDSMVSMNLLPLIIFSIVFAGMLTTLGEKAKAVSDFVVGVNEALMNFILLLMKLAPIGIFCLVAARFGQAQMEGEFLELLQTQAWYMATVLSGLAIHGVITLPLLLWIFTRRNPFCFFGQMSQAVLDGVFHGQLHGHAAGDDGVRRERRAKISKRSTEFVLPLGATINMDGTALYEAAAAIFIAQAYSPGRPANRLRDDHTAGDVIAVTATLGRDRRRGHSRSGPWSRC